MLAKPLLNHILVDEALTRGLGDAEARVLVEWLVDQAEELACNSGSPNDAEHHVRRLCLRARAISRFVGLWSNANSRGAATQLMATERFTWPMPEQNDEACEIMHRILVWEADQARAA